MNKIFEGKSAIITGGGRGIGKAVADAFSSFGASVVLNARNEREIDAVTAGINKPAGAPSGSRATSAIRRPHLCW